jgi:hypothetical protein
MDDTLGVVQTSAAVSTTATTNAQASWFRTFVSDPIAAQTIASQQIVVRLAASESNGNSDMFESNGSVARVFLWRPASGTLIGNITGPQVGTEPGTSQTAITQTFASSSSRTAQDGDVICVEIVSLQNQSMGTSYTNTVFYDGLIEDSTVSNAAHVEFTNNVALLVVAAANPPYRNQMPPLIAQ